MVKRSKKKIIKEMYGDFKSQMEWDSRKKLTKKQEKELYNYCKERVD